MVSINLKTEGTTRPQSFIIENILKNRCDIILNDNVQQLKETAIDEQGKEKEITKYIYDYYRIENVGYTDSLEEELKEKSYFDTWINFAKEQYAKQTIDVPVIDRVKALEQAVTDIGEVIGND